MWTYDREHEFMRLADALPVVMAARHTFGMTPGPMRRPGVMAVDPLAGEADKIASIKLVRRVLGLGLVESKAIVDRWQATGRIYFRGR